MVLRVGACALLAVLLAQGATREASAQDGSGGAGEVYRRPVQAYQYQDKKTGRQVFTNAGNVSVGGAALSTVDLPALDQVDLGAASPAQLQLLDQTVELAHDELQNGKRCTAIRASLRVPPRAFWLSDHLRELCVLGGLLVLALVVMMGWNGRLKPLMPLAPLLGCAYLGYATYNAVEQRLDVLREGLTACTSTLPPSEASSPISVQQRLDKASQISAAVTKAYEVRAPLSEMTR